VICKSQTLISFLLDLLLLFLPEREEIHSNSISLSIRINATLISFPASCYSALESCVRKCFIVLFGHTEERASVLFMGIQNVSKKNI
jgi:hypothetical protein